MPNYIVYYNKVYYHGSYNKNHQIVVNQNFAKSKGKAKTKRQRNRKRKK